MRLRKTNGITRRELVNRTFNASGATTYTSRVVANAGRGKYQWIYDAGPYGPIRQLHYSPRHRSRYWRYSSALPVVKLNPVSIVSCTCSAAAVQDNHTEVTFDPYADGQGLILPYKHPTKNQWDEAYGQFYGQPTVQDPKVTLGVVRDESPALDSIAMKYALSRANGKLSQGSTDMGQTLGEIVKTASLLVKPYRLLANLYKACIGLQGRYLKVWNQELKEMEVVFHPWHYSRKFWHGKREFWKRRLRNGGLVVNESASAWLEYRYGARPLMWEIDTYRKFMREGIPLGRIGRCRGVYEKPVSVSHSSMNTYTSNTTFHYTVDWEIKIYDGHYATVLYQQDLAAPASSGLTALGLHPIQAVNLAYELYPLSFMLDWFIDFDSWIGGLTPHPGRKYLGNSVSHKVTTELTGRIVEFRHGYTGKVIVPSWNINPYRVTWQRIKRTVNNPIPVVPAWNPKLLELSQISDILSVVGQRMPFLQRKR